jgi:uncharacterized membrane protein
MNSASKTWIPAVCFLALALPLAAVRPLWLDEILQLMDTRQPSATELVARLPLHDPGSAPLGYLAQQAALKLTGYSDWRARLPAVLFGAAAIFLTALLGAEFGQRSGWRSAALLAVFPLTLRYGTEARMYSQALFFSALASWIYMRLARNPGWALAGGYCLALLACVYTQPYSISVGLAHGLWSVVQRQRKAAIFGGAALALAVAAFLPWYWHAKAIWTADLADTPGFSASLKTPLMIFREFSGAGYWGSALLAVLCALTVTRRSLPPRALTLLVLLIVVPIAAAVAGDAVFGYFLAVRQFLWALPAAAILAAAATEHRSRAAHVAVAMLTVVCMWQSVRFFSAPHENWRAAADAIEDRVKHGDCPKVAPPAQASIYEFFHPELEPAGCHGGQMVLAVTPYATTAERETAVTALTSQGCQRGRTNIVGGSQIVEFLHCR